MKEDGPCILAIDVGTSSLKAVIYNSAGKPLASASRRYEYRSPQAGWAETNPSDWWKALVETLAELRAGQVCYARIRVVAFTGQMHTAVLLDEGLNPLEPTILWLDRRAAQETVELQEKFGLPPYHLNSTYTLPKLFWLARHRPEVIKNARHILWAKDYLRHKLTGRLLTDYTEAGGAALLDWQALAWAKERLEWAGIASSILPPLCQPGDDGGPLLPELAGQFDLDPGIKVIVGAGDVLALITAAPPAEGRVTCSLGTSSMIFCPLGADQSLHDTRNRIYIYPLLPYRLLGGVSSTSGASLQWAWQALYGAEQDYQATINSALTTPPGSEGLIYLPFLSGERSPYWNDGLRGGFYGLTLAHSRLHLMRAVMEGVAYSLRYLLDVFRQVGVPVKEIALAGGGATTPGWPQIIADVCQLPVAIYSGQDTVTHALYAYACQHLEAHVSFEDALMRTFHQAIWVLPNKEYEKLYSSLYERYVLLANFANSSLSI